MVGSRLLHWHNVVFNHSTVEMSRYFSYFTCNAVASALSYCEQTWTSPSLCLCFMHMKGRREYGNTSPLCKFETEHLTQQSDFAAMLLVRPAAFLWKREEMKAAKIAWNSSFHTIFITQSWSTEVPVSVQHPPIRKAISIIYLPPCSQVQPNNYI